MAEKKKIARKKKKVAAPMVFKKPDNRMRTISLQQFAVIFKENLGLCNRTAKAITKKYGIPITRQAVSQRAKAHPEIYDGIRDEIDELADETLLGVMITGRAAERLKAVELYNKSTSRAGFTSVPTEITVNQQGAPGSGSTQLIIKVAQPGG